MSASLVALLVAGILSGLAFAIMRILEWRDEAARLKRTAEAKRVEEEIKAREAAMKVQESARVKRLIDADATMRARAPDDLRTLLEEAKTQETEVIDRGKLKP